MGSLKASKEPYWVLLRTSNNSTPFSSFFFTNGVLSVSVPDLQDVLFLLSKQHHKAFAPQSLPSESQVLGAQLLHRQLWGSRGPKGGPEKAHPAPKRLCQAGQGGLQGVHQGVQQFNYHDLDCSPYQSASGINKISWLGNPGEKMLKLVVAQLTPFATFRIFTRYTVKYRMHGTIRILKNI